jgi:hypothetical protein
MGAFSDSTGGGGDMVLLYSTTLSSPASSITTGTLPTGYKSLVIDTGLRCDGSYSSRVVLGYFNGDTTKTNYQVEEIYAFSTTVAAASINYPYMTGTTGATASASFFGADRVIIRDHESTDKYKTWNFTETAHMSTAVSDRFWLGVGGTWRNTAAITSITFEVDDVAVPDFIAGSFVAVYGLK